MKVSLSNRMMVVLLFLIAASMVLTSCGRGGAPPATKTPAEKPAEIEWPKGPMTLVVPFAPGGLVDVFARGVQPYLSKELNVPVVVENKAGAGTRIGNEYVFAAKPDGYTFLVANNAEVVFGEIVYDVKYKSEDFTHIESFFSEPPALVVGANSFKSMKELIEAAKSRTVRFGVIGTGGYYHLQAVLIEKAAGVKFSIVPFKGGSEIASSIQGGHIDAGIVGFGFGVSQEKAGQLKVVAQVGDKPHPAFTNIPVVTEAAPGFEGGPYVMGILAPPNLPAEIKAKMVSAFQAVVKNEEFRKWAEDNAMYVMTMGPDDYKKNVLEFKQRYLKYESMLKDLVK